MWLLEGLDTPARANGREQHPYPLTMAIDRLGGTWLLDAAPRLLATLNPNGELFIRASRLVYWLVVVGLTGRYLNREASAQIAALHAGLRSQ